MTKQQQEAAVVLGAALIAQAAVNKVIGKQAAVLGIPVFALAVLGWMATRAIG